MIKRRALAGSAVTTLLVLVPAAAADAATSPSPSVSASPSTSPKPTTSATPTASPKPSVTSSPKPTTTSAPTGAPRTGFGDSGGNRDVAVGTAGVLALAAGAAIAGITLTRRRGQY